MNLKPRAIILLAIDAFGGKVDGKTLLQKRLYFTEILVGEKLGLEFDAHYYGPYSAVINSELSTLKLQGQLREETSSYGYSGESGFEMRRHCYELTPDGKAGVQWLRQNYASDCQCVTTAAKRVVDAGNLDYMELSFAAKSHWILRKTNKPLSETDIANEAGRFGWEVKPAQVHRGVEFLHKVGLVRSAAAAGNA
jgi:hypothetical protein